MEEAQQSLEYFVLAADSTAGVSKSGGAASGGKKASKSKPKAAPTVAVPEEVAKKRFEVLRGIAEECVTDADLKNLVSKKEHFRLYDGFEPSGRMHIAQGTFKAINVNKCTANGGTFVFWVADWFALMNDKMGGDLDKIKVVGNYLIQVWKAAGMNMENVEFRWASDDIVRDAKDYWPLMLDIAKRFTINRITKCCQIMGRLEGNLSAAQLLYPLMQCTDIFYLKANICQLGLDQRKVNMLAREYCDSKGIKLKPVILSHHMLYGLKKGQEKMSKSDPDSAVFMEDTDEDVRRKITNAYCPRVPEEMEKKEGESMHLVEDDLKNPCLDYVQYIVMNGDTPHLDAGGKTYKTFEEVKAAFVNGELSETDLKEALIQSLSNKIRPVREHFQTDAEAKKLFELIQSYKRGGKLAPVTTKLRRHVYSKAEGDRSLVVAPIIFSPRISLGTVLSILKSITHMADGAEKVLLLPDLSAIAHNVFSEDKKTDPRKLISAAYTIVSEVLKVIAPEVMKDVKVVLQSSLMLSGPSDYWISVINVGRFFKLNQIMLALEDPVEVGPVIASLIDTGDVISIAPERIICTDVQQRKRHGLSATYLTECGQKDIGVPSIVQIPGVESQLQEKKSANINFVDDDIFVTDSAKVDLKRKIKRAFCEPQNTKFNPPLALAIAVGIALQGKFEVPNKKTYIEADELIADVASGELHPSELKPAVTSSVQGLYNSIEAAFKIEPLKSAKAKLAQYEKKIKKR